MGPSCRPVGEPTAKVEAVIREELDAIGAQEMLMPGLRPAEIWKRRGRWEIDELFGLEDRKAPSSLSR